MLQVKCERDKYLWIYSNPKSGYGHTNHGRNAYGIVLELNPCSLLDVGCGKGEFVETMKQHGIDAVGMDFASGYGVEGDILDIPYPDNSFDIVTAFDVLEHIEPENLDIALGEMCRVAMEYLVLSIGYGPSRIKMDNGDILQLHPIAIRDKDWWDKRIKKYGLVKHIGRVFRREDSYIIVRNGRT